MFYKRSINVWLITSCLTLAGCAPTPCFGRGATKHFEETIRSFLNSL